jgi:hypothetical protein
MGVFSRLNQVGLMKIRRLILFLLGTVLLTSCAHLTAPVSSKLNPDDKTAILYGRLTVEKQRLGQTLALWIWDFSQKDSVYFGFNNKHPVYAIPVQPHVYRVYGIAIVGKIGQKFGENQLNMRGMSVTLPFQAPTNAAVYIGDYVGYPHDTFWAREWILKSITTNYVETTAEFHREYPNLTNLPTYSMFDLQKYSVHP